MPIRKIAEHEVQQQNTVTLSVDTDSNESYFIVHYGASKSTFPKTVAGKSDAIQSYHNNVCRQLNSLSRGTL